MATWSGDHNVYVRVSVIGWWNYLTWIDLLSLSCLVTVWVGYDCVNRSGVGPSPGNSSYQSDTSDGLTYTCAIVFCITRFTSVYESSLTAQLLMALQFQVDSVALSFGSVQATFTASTMLVDIPHVDSAMYGALAPMCFVDIRSSFQAKRQDKKCKYTTVYHRSSGCIWTIRVHNITVLVGSQSSVSSQGDGLHREHLLRWKCVASTATCMRS